MKPPERHETAPYLFHVVGASGLLAVGGAFRRQGLT